MTIVAEEYEFVVGIDTHARTHTLASVHTHTSGVTGVATFPATPAGTRRAMTWITRQCPGVTLVVIEGIGSYGALIAHQAAHIGLTVTEPMPVATNLRAHHGKSDPVDAQLIARSVLAVPVGKLRSPRDDQGPRAGLRILTSARDQINRERTATINTLTALLRTTSLGIDARQPLTRTQTRTIASWRTRDEALHLGIARQEATRLARRVLACTTDLAENTRRIHHLVNQSPAAILLNQPGIGPISAAVIYLAWSHPGRIHNEASFANLAGTAPIPASSGNTTHHRLNRGGDRQLNQALHIITLTRLRCHPETRAYHTKRQTQGHTTRDTRRILKRYIARQTYRLLNQQPTT